MLCKPCGCECDIYFHTEKNRLFCQKCGCPCGGHCYEAKGFNAILDVAPHNDAVCCSCAPKCFPGEARVSLKNGKIVPMSGLRVGDHVQVGALFLNFIEFHSLY